MRLVRLKIWRTTKAMTGYFEHIDWPVSGTESLTDVLWQFESSSLNAQGQVVAPVFNDFCAGACAGFCGILVDGVPKLACRVLLKDLAFESEVLPLPEREKIVDLSTRFVSDKQKRKLPDFFGLLNTASPVLPYSDFSQQNDCTVCGLCVAVCSNFLAEGEFVGPLKIWQSLNDTTQQSSIKEYLAGCDQQGRCQAVCPQNLPLADSFLQARYKTNSMPR